MQTFLTRWRKIVQVLEFVNPVLNFDYKDDYILEPERGLSGVFNTFKNQCCVKTR